MKKPALLFLIFCVIPLFSMEQPSKKDGAVYLLAKSNQIDLKTEAIQQYLIPQVKHARTLKELEEVCGKYMPLYIDCLSLRKHRNLYALDQAITHKEQEIALYIFRRLKRHGIRFDFAKEINKQGIPLLVSAAMINELHGDSLLELLLINGADPNTRTCLSKDTPLHAAAKYLHMKNARALLQAGADVNAQNSEGETPLYKAICNCVGQVKMIELLVDSGANVNITTNDGTTPLIQAIVEGYEKVAQFLIDRGADVKAQDDNGWSALHEAAFSKSKDRAQILISAGADVNAKTNDGWTPLHFAARYGALKLTQLLLRCKAHKAVVNNENQTPQDIALEYGHPVVAALLAP